MNQMNKLVGPIVSYTARTEGDYGAISISPSIRELLGYSPKDFTENPNFWVDNIHPEDRAEVLSRTPTLVVEGWLTQGYRFRHRDGSYHNMWDDSHIVQGEDNTLAGYWHKALSPRPSHSITPEGEIFLEIQNNVPGVAKKGDHILIRPGHERFAVVSHHLTEHDLCELIKHGLSGTEFNRLILLE